MLCGTRIFGGLSPAMLLLTGESPARGPKTLIRVPALKVDPFGPFGPPGTSLWPASLYQSRCAHHRRVVSLRNVSTLYECPSKRPQQHRIQICPQCLLHPLQHLGQVHRGGCLHRVLDRQWNRKLASLQDSRLHSSSIRLQARPRYM